MAHPRKALRAALLTGLTVLVVAPLAGVAAAAQPSPSPATPGTAPTVARSHALKARAVSANGLTPIYSASGRVRLWSAGIGTNAGPTAIPVKKSAGATVRAAFLFEQQTNVSTLPLPGDITLDDQAVSFAPDLLVHSGYFTTNVADVTSIIKADVDAAPAGTMQLAINEVRNTSSTEGEGLAIVFDDPTVTVDGSVILLYGAQLTTGDTFTVGLSQPVDKSNPAFGARLGLGIGFSYDSGGNAGQTSTVTVNSTLISSAAGGEDDAQGSYANGNLMTFGGPNHGAAKNPPDPASTIGGCDSVQQPTCDGEYYDVGALLTDGDTSFDVTTRNASGDDDIFYAGVEFDALTATTGPPLFTSDASTRFPVGTSGTFTVTTNPGYPTATTLTEDGDLPDGVTFVDQHDGTAILAGTPAAGSAASYPLTITAGNDKSSSTQTFTLEISGIPDHLVLAPATSTVDAGTPVTYTAESFDAYGDDLGDVTADTTFTTDDGACAETTCTPTTATAAGSPATVTGTDGLLTGTAQETVTAGAADHLVLTPATTSVVAGSAVTYTADSVDAFGNSLGDVTSDTTFTTDDGACVAAVCTPTTTTAAGSPATVTGADDALTGTATQVVTAGALDHLVLSPATTSVAAGSPVALTAEGFDAFGNSLGDVTAATTFTTDDGTCDGATCTPTTVTAPESPATVTGTDADATGTASMTVTAAAVDHLVLSPATTSVVASTAVTYAAEGFDAFGNDLGDVTAATTFTTDDGTCDGASCTPTAVTAPESSATVTGTDGDASGTAAVMVTPGPLDHLVLSPATTSVVAGTSVDFTAEGFDAFGNDLGDVTADTTFTTDDGTCDGSTCTPTQATAERSPATVTGADGTAAGTAALTVVPAGLDHLVLSPATTSVVAGTTVDFTAEGFDAFGNSRGDVTADTTFTSDDGACDGASCTPSTVTPSGSLATVTGTLGDAVGTAAVTVTPGPLDHLVLTPVTSTVVAGTPVTFAAEGFDAFGNDLGDVTSDTTFTTDDGTCLVAACTPTTVTAPGTPATVTGTDGDAAGTATLTVTAADLDHLVLSPATADVDAGTAVDYTAEGFDAFGNDLGDVTADTTFTTDDGDCTGTSCTPTTVTSAGAPAAVTGTDGDATGTAAQTVTPAGLDHLVLSPATSTVVAGTSVTYTAKGFDAHGNDLGDVTDGTTFTTTDGACDGAVCTPTAVTSSPATVTGTDGDSTGTAALTVTVGPLDHLVLSPATSTVVAGTARAFTAEGFDAFGNSRGDVTAATTFATPGATCTGASCTLTMVTSSAVVTGTDGESSGTAHVTVTPAPLARLALSPATSTVVAGTPVTFAAEGFDAFGNDLGDRTDDTTFTTSDGRCAASTCTPTSVTPAGSPARVTGTDGASTGTAAIVVTAGALDHISLTTGPVGLAGHPITVVVTGFDAFGNPLGDVTSSTGLVIGPDGSCVVGACTAQAGGAHTITATIATPHGSAGQAHASATVSPGSSAPVLISAQAHPGNRTITVRYSADARGAAPLTTTITATAAGHRTHTLKIVDASPSDTTLTLKGMDNAVHYDVTISLSTPGGAVSSGIGTVIPGRVPRLTLVASTTTLTAGSVTVLSGVLKTDATPLKHRVVTITAHAAGHKDVVTRVRTDGQGRWKLTRKVRFTTTYVARSTNGQTVSTSRRLSVTVKAE